MKKIGYYLIKAWIQGGLHLYFSKIKVHGLENVSKDKPVLFLANHQSALMDVLLIAVDCNRRPYFLTRADVFKKPLLKKFFGFLRMIPIYRIRDGRESLKNNTMVFDRCATLLDHKEAILMFPEANHSLKRRVRPLSKGFTRILFAALEQNPDLDIRLVPIGLNYQNAESFPDSTAIYFGEEIPVQQLYDPSNLISSTHTIKEEVSKVLKTLTTHIEDETSYDTIVNHLDGERTDYLDPMKVNSKLQDLKPQRIPKTRKSENGFLQIAFYLFNFPIILLWKTRVRPRVWEPEFTATIRFGFALLAFPLYYTLVFIVLMFLYTPITAFVIVLGIFLFNWGYVKL
ncbi:lysophospholipid acyltransferase family protein [Ulvibacterium sp.]|uniref:lysophospholipid acyltransferase family protein n=1 Tax=Ulvibacterium sp. TaxID=2665914 RepID=UPI0026121C32|nr:lysophospholipid acyltransferase family protein [Ulvibacterium sp.]